MATQDKDKVSDKKTRAVPCDVCGDDLASRDIFYHFGRVHGIGTDQIKRVTLLDAIASDYEDIADLKSEVSALREENARLRKALERVAAIPNGPDRPSTAGQLQWALDIVAEALR